MSIIDVEQFCGIQMRRARIMNNKTLDDLAEELNIDKKLLFQIEREEVKPTREQEQQIAWALDVYPKFFHWIETCPLQEDDINFSPRMKRM